MVTTWKFIFTLSVFHPYVSARLDSPIFRTLHAHVLTIKIQGGSFILCHDIKAHNFNTIWNIPSCSFPFRVENPLPTPFRMHIWFQPCQILSIYALLRQTPLVSFTDENINIYHAYKSHGSIQLCSKNGTGKKHGTKLIPHPVWTTKIGSILTSSHHCRFMYVACCKKRRLGAERVTSIYPAHTHTRTHKVIKNVHSLT